MLKKKCSSESHVISEQITDACDEESVILSKIIATNFVSFPESILIKIFKIFIQECL